MNADIKAGRRPDSAKSGFLAKTPDALRKKNIAERAANVSSANKIPFFVSGRPFLTLITKYSKHISPVRTEINVPTKEYFFSESKDSFFDAEKKPATARIKPQTHAPNAEIA